MTGPPILIEDVVAISGGPLEPGKAMPPQKCLKGDGVEAFAASDENWRAGLPIRTNNAQHLALPWRLGEGTNGEFLVHIISREGRELGGVALFHRRLFCYDLFIADGDVPPLEPDNAVSALFLPVFHTL